MVLDTGANSSSNQSSTDPVSNPARGYVETSISSLKIILCVNIVPTMVPYVAMIYKYILL